MCERASAWEKERVVAEINMLSQETVLSFFLLIFRCLWCPQRRFWTGRMKISAMLMMLQPMARPRRPPTLAGRKRTFWHFILFLKSDLQTNGIETANHQTFLQATILNSWFTYEGRKRVVDVPLNCGVVIALEHDLHYHNVFPGKQSMLIPSTGICFLFFMHLYF